MSYVIWFLFGLFAGWVIAHNVIATECKKVGSFYVGDNVYKCQKIERGDVNE